MIRPIDIQIKYDEKYAAIAFLVDRPDFLRDVDSIRRKWLNNLLPYSRVSKWLENLGRTAERKGKKLDSLWVKKQNGSDTIIFTDTEFVKDIDWLKKKYKKNMCYELAIAYAILSGIIGDTEFTTTVYVQYLDQDVIKNFVLDGHFQVSIVISPETSIEEVENIFTGEIRHFLKSIEFPKPDRFSNIRRDRDWYCLRKSMSWGKLYDHVKKTYKVKIENQSVRSAVRYYEKQLKIALYSTPPGDVKSS